MSIKETFDIDNLIRKTTCEIKIENRLRKHEKKQRTISTVHYLYLHALLVLGDFCIKKTIENFN